MALTRQVAFSFLIVFVNITCLAQGNFYKKDIHLSFNGGLVFGINFTQVDGDSYYGYNKIGLNAGGIVIVHFTSAFSANMELLYSQKGSKSMGSSSSTTSGVFDETYTMKLNYAEVPLLLRYNYHDILDFEAGISYAYLVNSSEYAQLNGQPVFISADLNKFNNSDLDYIVGFNVKAYQHLFVDCRFTYSITTIRPTERVPVGFSYSNSGQFNNMVMLRLMYVL